MTDDTTADEATPTEAGGPAPQPQSTGEDEFTELTESTEVQGPPSARFADIAELTYEDARDQLVSVVQRLESGQVPLDETMNLWERGEALADHCGAWLDRAEKRLDDAVARREQSR